MFGFGAGTVRETCAAVAAQSAKANTLISDSSKIHLRFLFDITSPFVALAYAGIPWKRTSVKGTGSETKVTS